jgi:beta-phosphoglucomutase-like phosphatase (HAD superfamily)
MEAGEAMEAGVTVAVCSTSNERAVSTIVRVLLGPQVEAKMRVFAGDVVKAKKPAPDIYNLAAAELGVDARRQAPARVCLHQHSCGSLPARTLFAHQCVLVLES